MFEKIVSIRQKFTVSMVYILIFEMIIFAVFIFMGGTLGMLVNNAYTNLNDTTGARSVSLEKSFNSVSGIADNNYESINNEVSDCSADNLATCDEAFLNIMPRLQLIVASENVTGAFVVLCNTGEEASMPAVFLRDAERGVKNQSFEIAVSSENLLNATGIVRSNNWTASYYISENEQEFISQTLKLSNENRSIAATELGYWSMPYKLNSDNDKVVAYTLPLRNENGECVGVFGVEMSLERMKECMPYLELNSKGAGSYAVLCKDGYGADEYEKIAVSGDTFTGMNGYKSTVSFGSKMGYGNLYLLDADNSKAKVYVSVNELDILKSSTYNHKVWVLCGLVDSDYINTLEKGIKNNVFLAFAITMLLGLIFAWVVSRVIANPIHKFLEEIKQIRPENPVLPSKSNIREINDLAQVVETLTDDIMDFSAKVSTIIDLSGVSFGAFEYDQNSDLVYCTDKIFTLLDLPHEGEKLFVSKVAFEEKMKPICGEIAPNIIKRHTIYPNGVTKYIYVKTAINDGKILGIIQDITTDKLNENYMKRAKEQDTMTGLLNRATFRRTYTALFANGDVTVAVLLHLNIDNMADINVRYGNKTGDEYICSLATMLRRSVESSNAYAARTAGDEFKYLLLGTSRETMQHRIDKLVDAIYAIKVVKDGESIPMQVSIGAAWYPADTDSHGMLEQYAEFAMHQVKRGGRNAIKYFDWVSFEEAEKNIRSSRNVEMLISAGLIHYAFQPIIAVKTADVYGYEALMRPDSTNAITPHDVIVFATEQNKLDVIERITWFTALEDFSMQVDAMSGKKMFINSIPSQFLSEVEFAEIENNYGEYLSNIVLEIIENEQTDQEIISKKKKLVEKWGCLLALDDYGSGYANDNTLLSLKPDVIKLDIEMITGIETDTDRQILVRNIIDYAHQRNIMVLGEGIETSEQMKTLIEYGVDLMQGFYLAKPSFDVLTKLDSKLVREIRAVKRK
jgi:diguanylate cyclase (GGDEF)-like protein